MSMWLLKRISNPARSQLLLLAVVGAVVSGFGVDGVARAGFLQDRIDADRALAELLDGATSRAALDRRLGVTAAKCVETSATTEMCGWKISRDQAIWNEIAKILGTRARISVVCALPTDTAEPRSPGSCSASPRESHSQLFQGARGTPEEGRIEDPLKERALLQQYETVAQAWLDQARTLVSMTRLMGKLPEECSKEGDAQRRCVWRLGQKDFGHGTAAMSIGASMRSRVWLKCVFPLNGAPRGEESCTVETAS